MDKEKIYSMLKERKDVFSKEHFEWYCRGFTHALSMADVISVKEKLEIREHFGVD